MRAWQYLALPLVVLVCSYLPVSSSVGPLVQKLSLQQQQHTNNRTEDPWPTIMEPAKVAQTAELIGVETNVATWSIGHAAKDFLAGEQQQALLLRCCWHCCVVQHAMTSPAAELEASLVFQHAMTSPAAELEASLVYCLTLAVGSGSKFSDYTVWYRL
jgi:hypothetical protein